MVLRGHAARAPPELVAAVDAERAAGGEGVEVLLVEVDRVRKVLPLHPLQQLQPLQPFKSLQPYSVYGH